MINNSNNDNTNNTTEVAQGRPDATPPVQARPPLIVLVL